MRARIGPVMLRHLSRVLSMTPDQQERAERLESSRRRKGRKWYCAGGHVATVEDGIVRVGNEYYCMDCAEVFDS